MERRVNFVLIGSLLFLILIMFVVFLLLFGRADVVHGKMKEYYIYTEYDISGISPKTPVKYKGLTIGYIRSISFEKSKIGLVKITLLIDREIKIKEGSSLVMDSQGLAGLNYLSLKQSDSEKIIDDKSDAILTLEQNFIGRITDQANQITNGVIEIFSDKNINHITKIIESLDSLSASINSISNITRNIDKKLQEGQYDLSPTLNQAQKSLQNLDIVLQKSSNILDKFNDNPYKTLFGEQR